MPQVTQNLLTGTGLDRLLHIIANDAKLAQGTPANEIQDGMEAAAGMNRILVDAIRETGIADDGTINGSDIVALNRFIRADHDLVEEWTDLHGDDENNLETGFHLIQADGARTLLYGANAVDKVADTLYHIGFQMIGRSVLGNEDGDANNSIFLAASYLDSLLSEDLAAGTLSSAATPPPATPSVPDVQPVVPDPAPSLPAGTQLIRSNGGEPVPYQDAGFDRYYEDDLAQGNDVLQATGSKDTFIFQYDIMTTPYFAEKHADADGTINWRGVAGENGATHDHWVQSGADDIIYGFNRWQDTIEVTGHTVNMWITYTDLNNDGRNESTVINVYSDQGGYDVSRWGRFTGEANGAHDGDRLGTITLADAWLVPDMVEVDRTNKFYGAYDTVDEIPQPTRPAPIPAGEDGLPENTPIIDGDGGDWDALA